MVVNAKRQSIKFEAAWIDSAPIFWRKLFDHFQQRLAKSPKHKLGLSMGFNLRDAMQNETECQHGVLMES